MKKIIVAALLNFFSQGVSHADIVASSSEEVIVGISELVVDLHNTKPTDLACRNHIGYQEAKFYFYFHNQKEKRHIASGCWVKKGEKIALIGRKLETKETFNYDQNISNFTVISNDWINYKESSAAKTNPPQQKSESIGRAIEYPKGYSREYLENKVPGIECQDFMGDLSCLSKSNTYTRALIKGISCNKEQEVMFTLSQGKVAGFTCSIDAETALSVARIYSIQFGKSKDGSNQIDQMLSEQKAWLVGDESHVITHWGGKNINGVPLDNYSFSISKK